MTLPPRSRQGIKDRRKAEEKNLGYLTEMHERHKRLIRTYSKPDETVLDIAAGSSTTAIAAIREGRRWLCIEKDAEAFDVSAKRIKQEMDAIR